MDPPNHREGGTRPHRRRVSASVLLEARGLRKIIRPALLERGRGGIAAKSVMLIFMAHLPEIGPDGPREASRTGP